MKTKYKLLLIAVVVVALNSCVGSSVRSPLTGIKYVDGKPTMDAETQVTLFNRISQILSGMKPKDIIYDAFNVSQDEEVIIDATK